MEKVIPKVMPGFMELLPEDQILFNEMIDIIRSVYEKFGFLPLDTPILEYSNVLLAKAGGETEKQIYRFKKGENDISLRFDLTVPLARYVSQRYNDLVFPFKRYQIGKVYRGERPQRGRFREFYQCDIDVIGENLSLLCDAEIPAVIYTLFKKLDFFKLNIRLNNRKILNGFFEELDIKNDASEVLKIIDKLEKIGIGAVREELAKLKISEEGVRKIQQFIMISGSNDEIIEHLEKLNISNDLFNEGLKDLKNVVSNIRLFGVDDDYFVVDLTIARGLDYYTGTVYETRLDDYPKLGSICSGGRYDNLTKYYSDRNFQGIGISIGLTRLFYQLKEAGIVSSSKKSLVQVLVVPYDSKNLNYTISVADQLREQNIICDIYYEEKNLKTKLKYANRMGIPYVCIIGDDEEKLGKVALKNMDTGEQEIVSVKSVLDKLDK